MKIKNKKLLSIIAFLTVGFIQPMQATNVFFFSMPNRRKITREVFFSEEFLTKFRKFKNGRAHFSSQICGAHKLAVIFVIYLIGLLCMNSIGLLHMNHIEYI